MSANSYPFYNFVILIATIVTLAFMYFQTKDMRDKTKHDQMEAFGQMKTDITMLVGDVKKLLEDSRSFEDWRTQVYYPQHQELGSHIAKLSGRMDIIEKDHEVSRNQ